MSYMDGGSHVNYAQNGYNQNTGPSYGTSQFQNGSQYPPNGQYMQQPMPPNQGASAIASCGACLGRNNPWKLINGIHLDPQMALRYKQAMVLGLISMILAFFGFVIKDVCSFFNLVAFFHIVPILFPTCKRPMSPFYWSFISIGSIIMSGVSFFFGLINACVAESGIVNAFIIVLELGNLYIQSKLDAQLKEKVKACCVECGVCGGSNANRYPVANYNGVNGANMNSPNGSYMEKNFAQNNPVTKAPNTGYYNGAGGSQINNYDNNNVMPNHYTTLEQNQYHNSNTDQIVANYQKSVQGQSQTMRTNLTRPPSPPSYIGDGQSDIGSAVTGNSYLLNKPQPPPLPAGPKPLNSSNNAANTMGRNSTGSKSMASFVDKFKNKNDNYSTMSNSRQNNQYNNKTPRGNMMPTPQNVHLNAKKPARHESEIEFEGMSEYDADEGTAAPDQSKVSGPDDKGSLIFTNGGTFRRGGI